MYAASDAVGNHWLRQSQIPMDYFWVNFVRNYLPDLQVLKKWKKDEEDLAVSQVALIIDPQHPWALRPVGRVSKTFLRDDGHIWSAAIQVHDKEYSQSTAQLIRLLATKEDGDHVSS